MLRGAAAGAAFVLALASAARFGLVEAGRVRRWYSEETSVRSGSEPVPPGQPRLRLDCTGLAVLVLDDHPLPRSVAAALASELAAAGAGAVAVHDAAGGPWIPGDAVRPDVLALVDLVHLDDEDWLAYQRCQVRLNVALGRPPRGAHAARSVDGDVPLALEYSVDGHFEVLGPAPSGARFAAAAESIAAGLAPLVRAVVWRRVDDAHAAGPSPPARRAADPFGAGPLGPEGPVPAGERQAIYDVVRRDGMREALLQVTTAGDWRAALARSEAHALELGWHRGGAAAAGGLAAGADARPPFAVLVRGDESLELALAYMQDRERAVSAQRQVLTFLLRTAPRR